MNALIVITGKSQWRTYCEIPLVASEMAVWVVVWLFSYNTSNLRVNYLSEDLAEKTMATHSSTLAWRIPGTAVGRRLWGRNRVRHD